jgi:hypothetical protein
MPKAASSNDYRAKFGIDKYCSTVWGVDFIVKLASSPFLDV